MRHRKQVLSVFGTILLLSTSILNADTTATQNVVFDLTDSYTGVSAIRIFDGTTENPTVTFNDSYQGTWQVTDAGAIPTQSHYAQYDSLTEKSGGSLQYTVENSNEKKITVHSATSEYNTESLYVLVGTPQDATGTDVTTLSTPKDLGYVANSGIAGESNKFLIPQGSGSAKVVIVGIPGSETFTGTAGGYEAGVNKVPGAPVTYGFAGDPGTNLIAITYTIMDESSGSTNASFF